MKRGAGQHPKFDLLMRLLSIPRHSAVGIMVLLWDFAATFAKNGAIGGYDDGQLAAICDWKGKPKVLISALTKAKWIDEHKKHRLIIHDWPDHCEDFIHMHLARSGERFANGNVPKMGRLTAEERENAMKIFGPKSVRTKSAPKAHYPDQTRPDQTRHDLTGPAPDQTGPAEPAKGGGSDLSSTKVGNGEGGGGGARDELAEKGRRIRLIALFSSLLPDTKRNRMLQWMNNHKIDPALVEWHIADITRDNEVRSRWRVLETRMQDGQCDYGRNPPGASSRNPEFKELTDEEGLALVKKIYGPDGNGQHKAEN